MSKIQCAAQRRAISELMCQGARIPFIETDSTLAALKDEGVFTLDMVVVNLKCAQQEVNNLAAPALRKGLQSVHEQAIGVLDELAGSMRAAGSEAFEAKWPEGVINSLRVMLASVDCTSEVGQAEVLGMVRALAEFGLVSQPDSLVGKVA